MKGILNKLGRIAGLPKIRVGDVYLIPLDQDTGTIGKVLGLGHDKTGIAEAMVVDVYDVKLTGGSPRHFAGERVLKRYSCMPSFAQTGKWSRLGNIRVTVPEPTEIQPTLWGEYDLFLDDVRQRLGLERLKYKSAQFSFSTECSQCGEQLQIGFARCQKCGAIRQEFAGLDRFVVDATGHCCLSGSATDVKGPDGNYYWAPYFIDMVTAGKIKV